jgi:glycosyltransferase involved in cell wall biosynthesis
MSIEGALTPLVSILIPVYNHEKYIIECLDSIAKQDYINIEVLLLDDGSKDDSYNVALSWIKLHADIRVTISRQDNQGVCKTLNTLIQQSSGEYIVLCASDDSLSLAGISRRVRILEENSSKLAVVGDAKLIDQNSKEISSSAMAHLYHTNYTSLLKDIKSELVFHWSVVGPTLLIKRSAYDLLGMYDEKLLVEDREFYLRLLAKNTLLFFPEQVASYRIHTDNASRKSIGARLVVYEQVAISNLKHAQKFDGIKYIFLKSYLIDALILKVGKNIFSFCVLSFYRALRYFLFVKLR